MSSLHKRAQHTAWAQMIHKNVCKPVCVCPGVLECNSMRLALAQPVISFTLLLITFNFAKWIGFSLSSVESFFERLYSESHTVRRHCRTLSVCEVKFANFQWFLYIFIYRIWSFLYIITYNGILLKISFEVCNYIIF